LNIQHEWKAGLESEQSTLGKLAQLSVPELLNLCNALCSSWDWRNLSHVLFLRRNSGDLETLKGRKGGEAWGNSGTPTIRENN
jgi:hypothetical protein